MYGYRMFSGICKHTSVLVAFQRFVGCDVAAVILK